MTKTVDYELAGAQDLLEERGKPVDARQLVRDSTYYMTL